MSAPTTDELRALDHWFRAANYLTVGQIYLQENALLREPLTPAQIKPRLLGHWGTSPGINFIWAHLNRLIANRGQRTLLMIGPGHGGPAANANVWLEGVWSETYPQMPQDASGIRALFRAFSTPGGIPSHVSPPTPGSIHEGGELGYVLSHAFGAAFDNPELLVVAIVGDGEAETAPLEGSWKGVSFLNAARDGAVLPILHLNGYKIANPTVLARKSDARLTELFEGHGYDARFIEGDDPAQMHALFAEALDSAHQRIREIQAAARAGNSAMPPWPMLVLRTPKGWTGPKFVDGVKIEGTFRSHQVPLANVRENAAHLKILEEWLQSYRPGELFDAAGAPTPAVRALCPPASLRLSACPQANGGVLLKPLAMPDYEEYDVELRAPGVELRESTRQFGVWMRDLLKLNPDNFRIVSPDELNSNRLGAVLEATERVWEEPRIAGDDHLAPSGRVLEVLSEHLCEGWLEGYLLSGRHGLFATYEAFAMVVASMVSQHAKWLEMAAALPWRAPVASLNILLTSTCWRNDHNGFSHQGPGFIDTLVSKRGTVARVYLPPDENCLLSVGAHCFASRDYVNLIVIDKQPQLQWLNIAAAKEHCARGASRWAFASNDDGGDPDIVLGCAGDTPTLETVAAAHWLREHAPDLRVRVVNVVDLFKLAPPGVHPHGMPEAEFESLFSRNREVIFAFHGYPNLVHGLLHGRSDPGRFHVRGYREEGTTTTPFDMVVLNGMSRFHLVKEALRRAHRLPMDTEVLLRACDAELARHSAYVREKFEDLPEIRDWTWTAGESGDAVILALNCGSSSLKYALFDRDETRLQSGEVRGIGADPSVPTHEHAAELVFARLGKTRAAALDAVAHRFVHGGPELHAPTLLDEATLARLRGLVHFAPLHLPPALAVALAARRLAPGVQQLAVFDTDFHWQLPEVARRLPLPRALHEQGIRRYGFHGLSYSFVVEALGDALKGRAVIAHLGAGASLVALRDGRSLDTSMSFTPTSGIPSATRTGDLDPGVLLFLMRQGATADELEELVVHRSGLAAISEDRADMQQLLARRDVEPRAAAAVELFCLSVRKEVGALAAVLGGLDALVFTGGIGEHASAVRSEVCLGLAHLGVALDEGRNRAGSGPRISSDASACRVYAVQTDEERMLARCAVRALATIPSAN